jgi:hypothetical protein
VLNHRLRAIDWVGMTAEWGVPSPIRVRAEWTVSHLRVVQIALSFEVKHLPERVAEFGRDRESWPRVGRAASGGGEVR